MDAHATLRRSRTRFDSWLGHLNETANTACECDGCTTDFESVRRGSTPWQATWSNNKYSLVKRRDNASWQSYLVQNQVFAGSNPARASRERNVIMNTNQRTSNFKAREPESAYTLQLANGKTRSFENAEALAKWMSHQRGLEYRRSSSRGTSRKAANTSRRNTSRRNATVRASRPIASNHSPAPINAAPLARYAKRNSNEA